MARADDLQKLKELSTGSSVGYTDLTPSGAISTVSYGPWVPNTTGQGTIQVEQVSGSDAMEVSIEGSNTQGAVVELGRSDTLSGTGASWMYANWSGLAFIRVRVISTGTGGSVTATQVYR